jgi:hypothetical protein
VRAKQQHSRVRPGKEDQILSGSEAVEDGPAAT